MIPDDTIKIEIPIAVTTTTEERPRRRRPSWTTCSSEPAQEKFADWGYRPVNEAVLEANERRSPSRPACSRSTTSAAGRKVNEELFDPENGSIAKIEEQAGVSTET